MNQPLIFMLPILECCLFFTLSSALVPMGGWAQVKVAEQLLPPGMTQSVQVTSGGVFIPRNGGFEGRIGLSHVFFNDSEGGIMTLVNGEWPGFNSLAGLDMVFKVQSLNSQDIIEVRQSYDKNPRILFLEEGSERLGLRVLFNLYDSNQVYHGHGMTEAWLHPDGQIFITAAAMFENRAAHEAVTYGSLDIATSHVLKSFKKGSIDMTSPSQQLFLTAKDQTNDNSGLALYWKTGKMEHNTYIYRSSFGLTGAPSYFRWPDYHRQAYTQRTLPDYIDSEGERAPWPPGRGKFVDQILQTENGLSLLWPINQNETNPTASFNALFRLAWVGDQENARAFVEAERDPVTLSVEGGVIHGNGKGYNDQEGCYEIRKTGDAPVEIGLPADPISRTIRLKFIGLTGHGAVNLKLDGKSLLPQLSTDGGIADDPLAPIHDQPEGPANAAFVTIKLTDKPQKLSLEETEGIQLVYQTRDPRRNFMIFSSKTGPSWAGLQFSLLDGHARHMRAYGHHDWALTENLLQWFAYMGYSPEQMLDQLRDFEIVKNGPDEVVFRYTSNNANDGAQSVFEVSARADAPAMHINVRANFTVLEQWPYKSVQFFDVFPFKGVEPEDWWYDNVLFMDNELKWRTFETVNQIYNGQQDEHTTGPTFQGLYSSDRGNMLMLTKEFTHPLPTHYVICGNYVDLHSNVSFESIFDQPHTLEKGYEIGVEYELAIWGDEKLTRDALIDIGAKSLKAGTLVIPENDIK
ncbi:MAG: hypothetical protein IPL46_20795 [Saprospiraceae bacterium]|nr:hypothetical protein [Saprospiraceae bacterium]